MSAEIVSVTSDVICYRMILQEAVGCHRSGGGRQLGRGY